MRSCAYILTSSGSKQLSYSVDVAMSGVLILLNIAMVVLFLYLCAHNLKAWYQKWKRRKVDEEEERKQQIELQEKRKAMSSFVNPLHNASMPQDEFEEQVMQRAVLPGEEKELGVSMSRNPLTAAGTPAAGDEPASSATAAADAPSADAAETERPGARLSRLKALLGDSEIVEEEGRGAAIHRSCLI